jgi:coenzyme F420 hydrogenase subunit beta
VAAPGKIAMTISPEGFARPRQLQTLDEAEEQEVARICPGLVLQQNAAGRLDHVLWGPLIAVRSGYATDPALRRNASSGGALSALLVHLLETGAVDRVVQTAASPDLPIGNTTVITRTAAEVFDAAASRYAPSAPLEGLDRMLAESGRAAFVGKPCDVAALRALARRDPRIDRTFPYMVSFFCAGVPSLPGTRELLDRLEVSEAEVVTFRFRGDGWPGRATATLKDGRRFSMSYADSWGAILSRHVQFRCKICPDGTGGFADVVCADAWHCDERGYPLFEEADGVSLVISRTTRGEAVVRGALDAGRVALEPLNVDVIARMQPGQVKRKRLALARLAALAVLRRPRPRVAGLHLFAAARQAGLWAHLHSFIGTLRRVAVIRRPR